ncbi:MAG: BamA/TamA family outer membrane protein, partial [Elusimicrobia bacterium]|nr:BamA/TamA family outer membrane protein [Elusimicrobiota bacterium]
MEANQSARENESEYVPEHFEAKIPFLFALRESLSAGIALNFENWKIVEAGQPGVLQRDIPGLIGTDGSRLYTSTLLLRWDQRNSKTNPSQGIFLEGGIEYSKKLLGSESDFTRSTLETRYFFPVFGKRDHLFAVRIFADYKTGDVPFYLLPELGGIFFNRGLIEGRFRDTIALCGNWEYR